MNANLKQNSMEKLQATSTSIPVCPKGAFLVLFSMYYTSDLLTSRETTLTNVSYRTKTFTLQKGYCPAVNINPTIIPQTEVVKYLGLHFNCRLNWKEHSAKKRKEINRLKKGSIG